MRKAIVSVLMGVVLVCGTAAASTPVPVSTSASPSVSGTSPLLPLAFTRDAWNVPAPGVEGVAPANAVFYDRPLMLRQYGFGVLSSSLAGALGFYIGNAFEGAIFGDNSRKGYLSFTGIRYEHSRRFLGMPAGGPFLGGGLGMLAGGSLAVFFIGDSDEEPGSILWTVAGGALSTAAALALADAAGVGRERGMLAFVPLITLPPVGALGTYHVSRWFNDRKRRNITESSAAGPVLHAPRFGMTSGPDGSGWRLDALTLTF